MKGKRKEPTRISQNNSNISAEKRSRSQKRSRPVWGIEVSNVILTTNMMNALERFFIKRVCPWDDKLLGMGYTESKQSFCFEFQNESQQKAALCFDGHQVCQNKMGVKRWNQDSVPWKQESRPPEKGDNESVQSSPKSLPLPPAQNEIDQFGRKKKLDSSSETKGLSVDNGHSNIELEERLLAAANAHIKVLTEANINYEKRVMDQFSKIEELQVQLKKYQLLEKEQSLKKDQPKRKEDHNDMSESRLKSMCHEKDVQLRKHHSEMLSLKAVLRDALAARNRQEQVIRVQNLNTIERLKNLREEKDAQQQVLISNVQTLETQVKDATVLNHQKEQMIRILNHNIEVAEERFQKLQNEKSNKQEEERLKIQCKKKEDELEALSYHFSVLKQHAAKNEAKVAKMDIEREKVEAMRAFDRTNQASALAKLLEANKDLSKRNTLLAKDKDEWKRKVNAVRAENEEIHRRCRANEGLHHVLEDVKRDADGLYHRLRAEEEDKRRELRAMEDELAGHHRALRDEERKVGELYALQRKKDIYFEDMHKDLKKSAIENDELYARLKKMDSALENMHKDLKKTATENDELYARLKKMGSALEDTHKDLKKAAIENDELYNRLKKKDTDIQDWQDEMKLMERVQQELKFELKEMRRNNENQSSRHRTIEQGLQGELDGLKRQLKSASQERDHLINQLRNNDDQHNREIDMLKAKLKRLQSDNNLLRRNSRVDLGVQKSNTDSERLMHDLEYRREISHHGAKEAGMEEKEGKSQRVSHIQAEAMSHDATVKREKQESSPQPQQEQQFRESIQELEVKLFKVVQDQNVLLEENQKLRREKKDMQQSISKFAAKEGENEQLREEIEQMRMNHAMEMGLMDGSDESEEVTNLKEELERAHQRIVELEGGLVPTSLLL